MDLTRQLDILHPDKLRSMGPLHLIGAGGIGSPTAMALAKMGVPELHIWDMDTIEPHNLPNQMFRVKDIGKAKAEALCELCREFAGEDVKCIPHIKKIEGKEEGLEGIVISGVDSMASRRCIWEAVRGNLDIPLYIDCRMGGEVGRLIAVDPMSPSDATYYEKTLFSDEEAEPIPCTARAIIYNVFAIASLVASRIKKHLNEEAASRDIAVDLFNAQVLHI
jgi:molybdopterin/thiamine biosynthesis adenylyltransferase